MVTWIGADWDSVKCVVAFVLDGEVVTKPVKRRPDAVRSFFESYGIVDPVVAIESGDQLWADLWRAAGAVVHVFDGKKARRFSELSVPISLAPGVPGILAPIRQGSPS